MSITDGSNINLQNQMRMVLLGLFATAHKPEQMNTFQDCILQVEHVFRVYLRAVILTKILIHSCVRSVLQ